ncbi:hypothetical protein ACH5RR_015413 [Cinchona calisaya]|uniref:Uncharacterized protein n=1 Tax=Cinchona calisaya TaxID=153742 RepID=A0ABD2ZT40_9GENT
MGFQGRIHLMLQEMELFKIQGYNFVQECNLQGGFGDELCGSFEPHNWKMQNTLEARQDFTTNQNGVA